MFTEIAHPPHVAALLILPKVNPAHARKLIETSWNLLGIVEEWKKRTAQDGGICHEVSFVIGPVEQGDCEQSCEFWKGAKPLM